MRFTALVCEHEHTKNWSHIQPHNRHTHTHSRIHKYSVNTLAVMSQKRQLQQLLSVWPICVSECVPFCALPCVCIESVSCQTPSLHWHPLLPPLQYTFSCLVCALSRSVSLSRSLFVFMKNYKSASQLKYFRLSEQQCAIENSYLAIGICPEICNGNWAIGQRGNEATRRLATGQLGNWATGDQLNAASTEGRAPQAE